jgi:hypothetical protein
MNKTQFIYLKKIIREQTRIIIFGINKSLQEREKKNNKKIEKLIKLVWSYSRS